MNKRLWGTGILIDKLPCLGLNCKVSWELGGNIEDIIIAVKRFA